MDISSIIDTFYNWPLGGPVWREGLSQTIRMISIRMIGIRMINMQSFTLNTAHHKAKYSKSGYMWEKKITINLDSERERVSG